MIKGKTKSGFEFQIPEENLDNYDFIDALSKTDENPIHLPRAVEILLGTEQKDRLLDHLREDNGKVKFTKVTDELMEIMTSTKQTKNS